MTDPIANADPPLRAHMSVPYDAQSLDQCIKDAYDSLTKPTRWRQDFLGLQYRTLCLPKELVKQGFAEVSKVVDVSTMAPLDPAAHPDLTRIMDFATRAGVAALMLYRTTLDKLGDMDAGKQDWSISYYRSYVRMRAEKLDVDLSLDDLRFLAATSTLRSGAGAPKRDWPVLMQDDTKWCLVAPPPRVAGPHRDLPANASFFRGFFDVEGFGLPAGRLAPSLVFPGSRRKLGSAGPG